jgi:hypothetical protein
MKQLYLIFSVFVLTYSRLPPRYKSFEDFIILPLNQVKMVDSDYQLFLSKSCPFAIEIEREILYFLNLHTSALWSFHEPNAFFHSPTLRINSEEGYVNYRGTKAIKEALLSLTY